MPIFYDRVVLYAALHYWIIMTWVFLRESSRACFVFSPIKFPGRYVSCACGPLHKQPRCPHSFPYPFLYPPLRLSAACLEDEETLPHQPNPAKSGESRAFLLSSSINRPRFPPIGGLSLIDLVSVFCFWSG